MHASKYFLFFFLFLSFGLAHAHLDSGEDIIDNGHIIDMGHSPKRVIVGDAVNFALNIVDESTESPLNVSSVWVRISYGKDVMFSGALDSQRGSSTFSFIFPRAGEYALDTRFMDGDDVVDMHTFNIHVHDMFSRYLLYILIIMSVFVVFYFMRNVEIFSKRHTR